MKWNQIKKWIYGLENSFGLVYQFIRWFSILFFFSLFFVGLIFRIPWRMLFAFAAIPSIALYVPKKIQKFIWPVCTVLFIGVYVWIIWPQPETSHWRPYQFHNEPQGRPQIDPENAAEQYNAFFKDHGEKIFAIQFKSGNNQLFETLNKPWIQSDYPELYQWITDHKHQINRFIQAASQHPCFFELPLDLGRFHDQKKRINYMKAWSKMVVRSAFLDLGCGNEQAALDKFITISNMARQLYNQKNILDQATGFYFENMAARCFYYYIINHSTSQQLNQINEVFQSIDPGWPQNWGLMLHREKILMKNIASMFYEINDQEKIRISRNLARGIYESFRQPPYTFLNDQKLSKCLSIIIWMSVPSNPEKLGATIERKFDKYQSMVERDQSLETADTRFFKMVGLNYPEIFDWLIREQVAYYFPLESNQIRHETLHRVAQIFIEMKLYFLDHGQWPAGFEDIIGPLQAGTFFDPVSELPFIYKTDGQEFIFYSVGPNKEDQNGLNNLRMGFDDRVFWPIEGIGPDSRWAGQNP